MYQQVYYPEFTNREDFIITVQIADDDTGDNIDLVGIATVGGVAFTSNAWTVTDGAIVTASATQFTLPALPYTGQLSALAITVGTGLAIAAGDPITIKDTATGLNSCTGYVVSYASATGALVVQVGWTYQFEIRSIPEGVSPTDYAPYYTVASIISENPILTASLASGNISVIDLGMVQVLIPEATFKTLCGGMYSASMTMTDSVNTRQLMIGSLPVYRGGVTN